MIKNFIRDQFVIINRAINSVATLFNIQRYGLKGCEADDCYEYNLIRFELLNWQLVKDDTSYLPNPPVVNKYINWGYFEDDPYSDIVASGTDVLQFQKVYINNPTIYQDLEFTNAASDKYLVLKEPIEATSKIKWDNTSFNYGVIPDQVFRAPVVFNQYRYYVSRTPVFLSIGSTKISFQ